MVVVTFFQGIKLPILCIYPMENSTKAWTVIHGPFIIIDQVLYDNPKFNFTHNRRQFGEYFPK